MASAFTVPLTDRLLIFFTFSPLAPSTLISTSQPVGKIEAFVHVDAPDDTVRAHDRDFLEHIGPVVLFNQVAGGGLDNAIEDAVGLFTGDDAGHLIVHAQQQGDHLAHTAPLREDTCEATAVLPSV